MKKTALLLGFLILIFTAMPVKAQDEVQDEILTETEEILEVIPVSPVGLIQAENDVIPQVRFLARGLVDGTIYKFETDIGNPYLKLDKSNIDYSSLFEELKAVITPVQNSFKNKSVIYITVDTRVPGKTKIVKYISTSSPSEFVLDS